MRPLLNALGALLFIIILSLAVTITVASDLRVVKGILNQDTRELDVGEVEGVQARLQRTRDRLDSLPARMLRFVPVIGQNLAGLRNVVDASIPTLQAGLDLNDAIAKIEARGLVEDGRINIDALERLRKPIEVQALTMSALVDRVRQERDGWLAPSLWDSFDELHRRAKGLQQNAQDVADLLGISEDLLGGNGLRRYLVVLVNNSELRGAGGLLSGVGTLEVNEGRLQFGKFSSVHDLRDDPPVPVKAPPEFERRYGVFDADKTLWLNTTYSPDVPDVALVASRLFRLKTGITTDGAIVIDPRGIAALLPGEEKLELPGTRVSVPTEEIADFIYSDAYETFTDQVERRDAILTLGRAAFGRLLTKGLGGKEALVDLATAFGEEHIRFISFDPREQEVLNRVGISGELRLEDEDAMGLLVAAQNLGGGNGQGTKLDFWARRSISHTCALDPDEKMVCATATTIENNAPPGLITYVRGRDGVLRSYLETYLPEDAELSSVSIDGGPAEFRSEEQAGRISVAVFVKVPRTEKRRVRLQYELPAPDSHLTWVVDPQPLTHNARLRVRLELPRQWVSGGAGDVEDGVIEFDGELRHTLRFDASPDPRSGISALWRGVLDFLHDPLF
jgi:hypothetical protein